jgi:hypothetical protein
MTAVEFIEDYLKFKGIIIDDKTIPQVLVGVIKQAKEMEKQQIIDAYNEGLSNWDSEQEAKQYYNEKFNNLTKIQNNTINLALESVNLISKSFSSAQQFKNK